MNRSDLALTFRAVAELAMHAEDQTRATLDDDSFHAGKRPYYYRVVRQEDIQAMRVLLDRAARELETTQIV